MRFRINRRAILGLAGLAAVLALLLAGAFLLSVREGGVRPGGTPSQAPEKDGMLYYDGRWLAPREDLETVLVLGLDRSGTEGIGMTGEYAQSDFVLLLVMDKPAGRCTPILLNRDTMASIQDFDQYGRPSGRYEAQLALAYAHAQAYTGNDKTAAQTAADAVSRLLYGVKIDHYVTVTMDGLMALNDLVGGVEVEIVDDFSAVDPTLRQGERVTLLGEHALNYVRARWYVGGSSNLERMARQRTYLKALQEKLSGMAEDNGAFTTSALLALNEHMDSDCTAEQLSALADTLRSIQVEEFISPEGELTQGENYMEFRADEDALQRLVAETFYHVIEEESGGT